MIIPPVLAGGLVVVGLIAGYLVRQFLAFRQLGSTEVKIREQLKAAKTQAEESILAAKDKAANLLEEAQQEERSRKAQFERLEERLLKKEDFWTNAVWILTRAKKHWKRAGGNKGSEDKNR